MKHDIFICHASEDKISIARPLATCLSERGLSYWFGEAEISAGESITEKVNEGLRVSNFVAVILSRAFMIKPWPKKELRAVLNLEAKSDREIIIPILVGTQAEVDVIIDEFPLLNDKLFLLWDSDANRVANAVQRTVLKLKGQSVEPDIEMHICGHCATPFQRGVHVCLGCHGTIKYGITPQERLRVRQTGGGLVGILSLFTMLYVPLYSDSWPGIKIPMMCGIGFWSLPAAVVLALAVAFYAEARVSKRKSHLVRTFR